MAETFDQALFVQPAQVTHCRRGRNIRPDAHAFDRDFASFAIGNKQIEQHVPSRFGKQAAREVTRAQPAFPIKRPGCFKQKIR